MLKLTINMKLIVPCVWNLKKNYPKLRSPVPPMVRNIPGGQDSAKYGR